MLRFSAYLIVASLLLAVTAPTFAEDSGSFEQIKAKTFAKDKFVFPDDLDAPRLNVLFLALSADQDNGEYQQGALLEWQVALTERGVFTEDVVAWHFPVMPSPPFFVKGMIARAMRDSYEGKISLDHGAILYVDDLDRFAAAAHLTADERPTIVIASAGAVPLQTFKGEVSPEGADEIAAAVAALLTGTAAE